MAVPGDVADVNRNTFCNYGTLMSVAVPGDVVDVRNTFGNYGKLRGVAIRGKGPLCRSTNGYLVEANGGRLVLNYYGDVVPGSKAMGEVNSSTFRGYRGLTSVGVPSNVARVKSSTFEFYDDLRSMAVPGAMSLVSNFMFFCYGNVGGFASLDDVSTVGCLSSAYGLRRNFVPGIGLTRLAADRGVGTIIYCLDDVSLCSMRSRAACGRCVGERVGGVFRRYVGEGDVSYVGELLDSNFIGPSLLGGAVGMIRGRRVGTFLVSCRGGGFSLSGRRGGGKGRVRQSLARKPAISRLGAL